VWDCERAIDIAVLLQVLLILLLPLLLILRDENLIKSDNDNDGIHIMAVTSYSMLEGQRNL
jgi:hypothetical protein